MSLEMTEPDVYAPPAHDAPRGVASHDADDVAPPTARLYAPWAIMTFGILFGPIVGAGMAATNYKRIGEAQKAQQMWAVGIACFLVIVGIVMFFGESGTLVRGATIGGTAGLASSLRIDQKKLVEPHLAAGGSLDSLALPLLFGLLFAAGAVGVAYLLV